MTTSYAVLGQFGDAIRFIFEGQTTSEGTHVGWLAVPGPDCGST